MKRVSYHPEGSYFRECLGEYTYGLQPVRVVKTFLKIKHRNDNEDLYKQSINSRYYMTKKNILEAVDNILITDSVRAHKIWQLTVLLLPIDTKCAVLLSEDGSSITIKDEEGWECDLIFYLDN